MPYLGVLSASCSGLEEAIARADADNGILRDHLVDQDRNGFLFGGFNRLASPF
jgi:hypothetical protein